MTPHLSRIAREGYAASRGGAPRTANPWRGGTVGARAWAAGWLIGNLPPVVRIVVTWGLPWAKG